MTPIRCCSDYKYQCVEHYSVEMNIRPEALIDSKNSYVARWYISPSSVPRTEAAGGRLTKYRNGNTLFVMRLIKKLILYCALFVVSVCAQDMPPTEASADGLAGSGKNVGQGWRKDGAGNWAGTGENLGRGWRTDREGRLEGTGENRGSGWRKDGAGNWAGTGENLGRGWRTDREGRLEGTGENLGYGWRKDGSGNWVGTGKNLGKTWRVK